MRQNFELSKKGNSGVEASVEQQQQAKAFKLQPVPHPHNPQQLQQQQQQQQQNGITSQKGSVKEKVKTNF